MYPMNHHEDPRPIRGSFFDYEREFPEREPEPKWMKRLDTVAAIAFLAGVVFATAIYFAAGVMVPPR